MWMGEDIDRDMGMLTERSEMDYKHAYYSRSTYIKNSLKFSKIISVATDD
jgi:hypothetical protein